MPLWGNGDGSILIVDINPSAADDHEGKPWQSNYGRLLRNRLGACGISLENDCVTTFATICHTTKDISERVAHCRPNLLNTIKHVDPEIILLLGQPAVESLIGHIWKEGVGSIDKWARWVIPYVDLNAWVCALWHPGQLLDAREKQRNKYFNDTLSELFACTGRPHKVKPDYEAQVKVVHDTEIAARLLADIRPGDLIGFDYECNMLNPYSDKAKLICASVAMHGRAIGFPWQGRAIDEMSRILRDGRIKKVAANMKMEEKWTMEFLGHPVEGWVWDVVNAAHILDPRDGVTGLKFQSFTRLGIPSYDDHIKKFLQPNGSAETNQILEQIDPGELMLYCGLDSLLTLTIALQQKPLFV